MNPFDPSVQLKEIVQHAREVFRQLPNQGSREHQAALVEVQDSLWAMETALVSSARRDLAKQRVQAVLDRGDRVGYDTREDFLNAIVDAVLGEAT